MKDLIIRTIRTATLDTMPLANMTLKVQEEVGELSEAVNHLQGYLPNKKMKEPVEGEVADVITSAIGVLVHAYPDYSEERLYEILSEQLQNKTNKWILAIALRKELQK